MKKWIYIANWKLEVTPEQARAWYAAYKKDTTKCDMLTSIPCIICPSYICLPIIAEHIAADKSPIMLGAQDCSRYPSGAYTGEVDASSLYQVGARYCIVGHYERRSLFGETTEIIKQKIHNLYAANSIPIVCIGNKQASNQHETQRLLADQLDPIVSSIPADKQVYIAYEPIYAIGTHTIPSANELASLFMWLRSHVTTVAPTLSVHYIYGGSVNKDTIAQFKLINAIDGFLIGKASTHWDTFSQCMFG